MIAFDPANEPKRILIIKPSAIGDIVHALPALNLIRRRWPQAHITWVVTPACAGMVERHPQIDQVIYFQRHRFSDIAGIPGSLRSMLQLFQLIRNGSYDLTIDLQGLFRSGWLTWKSGSAIRVGFANARELGWLGYTHRVASSWGDHAIDRYLCIAEALGCGKDPIEFRFAVDDADRAAVAALAPADAFAVLIPGANWLTKQWPVNHYAALVKPLRERFGLSSVVVGADADRSLAARMTGALDLTGRTNLRQLVALLERAKLVVAGDTGPMHIASALGRPLVALHGPTDAALTGPYRRLDTVVQTDIECRPCFSRTCSHRSCLEFLEIAPVLAAIQKQLAARKAAELALAPS